MKRILILLVLFLFAGSFAVTSAFAALPKKVIVQFEANFSTSNPKDEVNVIVYNDYKLNDNITLKKGTKFALKITKISAEKIGKMDASAQAEIEGIYLPGQNKMIKIKNQSIKVKLTKYQKLDVADKTIDAGISVANHFVKNVTIPAHFVKGAVMNNGETDNRLESGLNEAYNASVFSYASKGNPLEVQVGGLATMSLDSEDVALELDTNKE